LARARGLLDPGDRTGGGGPQTDRDGHGLGVLEQQRRQLGAGAQPVAAGGPGGGLDRVAERAQLVDITADRPRPHLEAIGELMPGPFAAHLEQGQEGQQAGGGLEHRGRDDATPCGQELSSRI
jgi:hypothetical protein